MRPDAGQAPSRRHPNEQAGGGLDGPGVLLRESQRVDVWSGDNGNASSNGRSSCW
jgi:hypothetical protein